MRSQRRRSLGVLVVSKECMLLIAEFILFLKAKNG
jgi:hypothetical protein